ncbi:ABC transporter ATP-binding protein [Vibrio rarus]|uniref:ABC transporter ATP-binding protein n=1 Tax=Vibrio rarus TaxID=413403 RepID=UPI0021C3AEF0|nr:ABC transporter ATP-binding protein [Vibrio rarus]
MSQPLLQVNALGSMVNTKTILRHVSFELGLGSLVGIIGPNGAGKSTLLKHLSGYLSPQQGEVLLQGTSVSALPAQQRAKLISYLPQTNRVEFPYKVSEMVSLGLLDGHCLSTPEKQSKITQVLQRLGIESLQERTVDHLSGGEQQLVHLARILLQDTPLILLDEPSSSLDIGHEAQLMNILSSLTQEGKTVVVALHNLNTAAEFCDRLLLFGKGTLVADGTPQQLLTQDIIQGMYPYQVQVSINAHTGNPNILAVKD